ncbi:3-phosphoshikimate 1-carboxyvinyltransferase, variant [Aphanomyces invadans]|uniref:3-phosphoshikimate 1-carboxyvinyltransferase n=1 Tax=Aphanomyces invadans TaxID=157072 RepID=A0A024U5L7_9STRA|nr:3-phosphoshikimate 1-carboxyvinyltransferase, variant [Aphanomyces invadans]ETW01505.1 3-phosphoshikimate 1-carboxyvinyltransferase, variant [Aphanomyces invadans]|eukprot:XP_008869353.1 3-phosphoshikimate 1-carboxyvinyltransferase, variant [Aphanomyces invadans]
MQEIPCKDYVIQVGHGLLASVPAQLLELLPKVTSFIVISDSNVAPLYAQTLLQRFQRRVELYVVPAGEASKNRRMKDAIEDFMLEKRMHRDCCVVALGGGVVGDLAGFVASTYMRGVPFVQIPTSLLACVDSSIGGKTGIDVAAGKNLIGAFHQPKRVFADLDVLSTLPKRELINGMAEIIKAGAIYSESLFSKLESNVDAILALKKDVVLDMMATSVSIKATIVEQDEKEHGLRAILNFGHSVGHGIEAIMQPELLHGECVAIGMVKEAEIARGLGLCSSATVGRLVRCIKAFGLPVRVPARALTATVLEKMEVDKKNSGGIKKLILLTSIGTVHSNPFTVAVEDARIAHVLEPQVLVVPPSDPISGTVQVPGSKSISNRVLLMAALGSGTCRISGLLHSDDTQVMMDVLQYLGAHVSWENDGDVLVVVGTAGKFPPSLPGHWYLSNAGTATRFLTTVATLAGTPVHITGNSRMQERPISDLVDALVANGCSIQYAKAHGCPPLDISPTGLPGGVMHMAGKVSSQYVSSVLLSAPYANAPLDLRLAEDHPTSFPYIQMTTQLMSVFGIQVQTLGTNNRFVVPQGIYNNPPRIHVEVDASSATYPLAFAAISGGRVVVPGLGRTSCQGDAAFFTALQAMGCTSGQDESSTWVQGPPHGSLNAIEIDMETMTDAFMTLAVLAAVATGVTKITGIANQRVKECNRIAVMVEELAKCGVQSGELPDGLWIQGRGGLAPPTFPKIPAKIACHNDHRIAMSFAVLGSYWPNIVIADKECTDKTFPSFWDECHAALKIPFEVPSASLATTGAVDKSTVYLIGMRGVGKTSLGRHGAMALGLTWIDMDEYMETHQLGMSVKEYVAANGWAAFRAQEVVCLQSWVQTPPINTIVSCGGGVVESPEAVALLSQSSNVIYLQRTLTDIEATLAQDESRPAYGEDIATVFHRRVPLFTASSSFVFPVLPGDVNYTRINRDFVRLLMVVLGRYNLAPLKTQPDTYFVSLTFPNYTTVPPDLVATVADKAHALELRVDLLESFDKDFIANQVAALRAASTLPIIYTVRTIGQGGAFPDDPTRVFDLLHFGIALGCEVIDMECCWPADEQWRLIESKRGSAILASYHAIRERTTPERTQELFELCAWQGNVDMAKVVIQAYDVSDAYMIHQVVESCRSRWGFPMPCIALCTTEAGKLSRVLNRTLTPVTHPALPVAAAPGQLSIQEIESLRRSLGMVQGKQFYLFGSPIQHSPSPRMHNAAFRALHLPHVYSLHDATDIATFEALLHSPEFGGASVTIPLKVDIIPYLSRLSPAATAIGAVNTIIPVYAGMMWVVLGKDGNAA